MPSQRSEVTEIVTGLAMLGYQSIERALEVRPGHITHVTSEVFGRLEEAWQSGQFQREFALAWSNGSVFARADQALRGRPPWLLEWKGPHRPASKSIETIPADLRIDHVYLVSCKYGSQILHNSGPAQLFDHCLAPGPGAGARNDWYHEVAPDTFRAVWEPVLRAAGLATTLPPSAITSADRARLRAHIEAEPIDTRADAYQAFVADVSQRTASRWQANIGRGASQREMLWRLLRMQAAPYFLLGATRQHEPLRYRVATPWDFNQRYTLDALTIAPGQRGQPSVDWTATITDQDRLVTSDTIGYVEIRWSHHKLHGPPEAKIHLTTDPYQVPGYEPLALAGVGAEGPAATGTGPATGPPVAPSPDPVQRSFEL